MASLFRDQSKLSAYRDRRFPGSQEEYDHALLTSTTLYVGNMSFYTTEEQVYELFSRAGEIKKIIMGLDKNGKTPCGFCFVLYYSRADAQDSVKYISGTVLDDRPIRVDFDWGFEEGRQWGRGRSGGQVRDEYRTDYDPVTRRGGYGKMVERELKAQRELVDYGTGSLGSFEPSLPSNYGRHGGDRGPGGSYRPNRSDYRKRHRDDERSANEMSKRTSVDERQRDANQDSRLNPRFRGNGDSEDDEEDDRKRRR